MRFFETSDRANYFIQDAYREHFRVSRRQRVFGRHPMLAEGILQGPLKKADSLPVSQPAIHGRRLFRRIRNGRCRPVTVPLKAQTFSPSLAKWDGLTSSPTITSSRSVTIFVTTCG